MVQASLATVPLALLVGAVLTRERRRRGMSRALARRNVIAEVAVVVGTVPWVWIILTPLPGPGEVRLRPLMDLANVLDRGPVFAFFQIVGNLLVFACFGFFAPIRWPLGPVGVTVIAAAMSMTVETLQYALHIGRVASVDDVLLNALGALLAALASRRFWAARTWAAETPVGSIP